MIVAGRARRGDGGDLVGRELRARRGCSASPARHCRSRRPRPPDNPFSYLRFEAAPRLSHACGAKRYGMRGDGHKEGADEAGGGIPGGLACAARGDGAEGRAAHPALAARSAASAMPSTPTGRAARLARILGDQRPHPVDSDANDAVRDRLIAEMRAVGLDPRVTDDFACNGTGAAGGQLRPGAQPRRDDRPGRGQAPAARLALRQHLRRAGRVRRRHRRRLDARGRRPAARPPARPGRSPSCSTKARNRACSAPAPSSSAIRSPARVDIADQPRVARRDRAGDHVRDQPAERRPRSRSTAPPAARPVANSLSTDLYRLIPNSTDVAVFEERPWTILNFAVIGNETRYHSAGDDLAALDRRSLQHMGEQALGP